MQHAEMTTQHTFPFRTGWEFYGGGPSAPVLTRQIIRAIKFPPNQKRERTTEKKRLKGHGPGHTQCTRLHRQYTEMDYSTRVYTLYKTMDYIMHALTTDSTQTPSTITFIVSRAGTHKAPND